jgi:hypothetical protein
MKSKRIRQWAVAGTAAAAVAVLVVLAVVIAPVEGGGGDGDVRGGQAASSQAADGPSHEAGDGQGQASGQGGAQASAQDGAQVSSEGTVTPPLPVSSVAKAPFIVKGRITDIIPEAWENDEGDVYYSGYLATVEVTRAIAGEGYGAGDTVRVYCLTGGVSEDARGTRMIVGKETLFFGIPPFEHLIERQDLAKDADIAVIDSTRYVLPVGNGIVAAYPDWMRYGEPEKTQGAKEMDALFGDVLPYYMKEGRTVSQYYAFYTEDEFIGMIHAMREAEGGQGR